MTLQANHLPAFYNPEGILVYETPHPGELFYLRADETSFSLPYKVVDFDPLRLSNVCIRTDVYPLLWAWYVILKKLYSVNLCLMIAVYRVLKLTIRKDFVHPGDRVNDWLWMIRCYLRVLKNE
jgi:hypothetical protein